MSLPSRERGLKLAERLPRIASNLSLPSRERGLKFLLEHYEVYDLGRSLRGSVD